MKYIPLLVVLCLALPALPALAQMQTQIQPPSPLGQALSFTTAQTVSNAEQGALMAEQAYLNKKLANTATSRASGAPAKTPAPAAVAQTPAPPPAPVPAAAEALAAQAAQPASRSRRTLSVVTGQKKLTLEVPKDMCFIDRTSPLQEKIYQALAGMAEKNRDEVLLAVFMDCNSITSPDDWVDGAPNYGIFTWMNPAIGETTPMSRQDYLDMREASFLQYAKGKAAGFSPDKTVHRTENNVSLGMLGDDITQEGWRRPNVVIISTTSLRHVPVEMTLHYAGDATPSLEEAYPVMDRLVARQVALNR